MKNVGLIKKGNNLELVFATLEGWEDFDVILKYIQKYFKAKTIEGVVGPDAKVAFIKIDKSVLKLVDNCYGNSLSGTLKDIV